LKNQQLKFIGLEKLVVWLYNIARSVAVEKDLHSSCQSLQLPVFTQGSSSSVEA